MTKFSVAAFGVATFLAAFLIVPLQTTALSAKQIFPKLEKANPKQHPGCPNGPSAPEPVKAIDFSQPADDKILSRAWDQGIRIVFRYYDWEEIENQPYKGQCDATRRKPFNRQFDFPWRPGSSHRGKNLTLEERDRIHAKGFSIGIVFQHCNDRQPTFTDQKRAAYDAERVLKLAHQLSQPKGTAIFFAVDFDARTAEIDNVRRYFKVIGAAIKPHGYQIGVYGNGYVCKELKQDGLTSYCWISQSTGFQDSQVFLQNGEWDIKQCATRDAYSKSPVDFDPNILNPRLGSSGFWHPK